MAYIPLVLEPEPGPLVGHLIRRLEDHYFRDVHAMLRLPAPAIEVTPGCNFAIAQVLASVVSGVSVTLYKHSGHKGARFKIQADRVVLLVEAFYWGIRRMILNLNADRQRIAAAKTFLGSLDGRKA